MKYFIVSDIHGSALYCRKTIQRFEQEAADRMIILGDILYHGPRNDLPKDYDPKTVCELLNAMKDKILCVRGNCDTEVDQMVLKFSIFADYCIITDADKVIFATHGHKFDEMNLPPLLNGDILLHGHTHVPKCVKHETYTYMNPGSVSIPKEGSHHGYMLLENGEFTWKDFEGNVIEV